jgi:translocation and assembly module TamB
VRNSAANIEIFTPEDGNDLIVEMNGGPRTLALTGTINVDRGEYTFSGRRIRITQGAVVFLGESPINPILQITGEQQVRLAGRPAFSIQLLVGGTLLTPRLTIESNAQPPIAESDLLSYFAFGESTSSLIQAESGGSVGSGGSGGGELLGPIGALATQQLGATAVGAVVDRLEQGARANLGLDVVNITPAPLPAELAVQGYLNVFRGAQLEAGRYLGDRWFLAGQGRTAASIPGMRLEYRTPRGFEWITSWESRYLVSEPTLNVADTPATTKVLGLLFQWRRRF